MGFPNKVPLKSGHTYNLMWPKNIFEAYIETKTLQLIDQSANEYTYTVLK